MKNRIDYSKTVGFYVEKDPIWNWAKQREPELFLNWESNMTHPARVNEVGYLIGIAWEKLHHSIIGRLDDSKLYHRLPPIIRDDRRCVAVCMLYPDILRAAEEYRLGYFNLRRIADMKGIW